MPPLDIPPLTLWLAQQALVREGLGRRVDNGDVPRGPDAAGKGLVGPLSQQERGSGVLVFQPAAPGQLRQPELLLASVCNQWLIMNFRMRIHAPAKSHFVGNSDLP